MQKIKLSISFLFILLSGSLVYAAAPATAAPAKEPFGQPGIVTVQSISGQVSLVNSKTGQSRPLTADMTFGQGYSVKTGADGVVSLLFSNGSGTYVYNSSELSIDAYMQRPPKVQQDPKSLTEDPSPSYTKLFLKYGEMTGAVKKLKPSSAFQLKTANYTAGIRGTIFGARSRVVGIASDAAKARASGKANDNALPLLGEAVSDMTIFEGSMALQSNTLFSSSEDHSLGDVYTNTSPLNNVMSAGTVMTVGAVSDAMTIVTQNISQTVAADFIDSAPFLQQDFGITAQAVQAAVSVATESPSRPFERRSSMKRANISTKDGPGTEINVVVTDSSKSTQTVQRIIVNDRRGKGGMRRPQINKRSVVTNADGSTNTEISKIDTFLHPDGTYTDTVVSSNVARRSNGSAIYQENLMITKSGLKNLVLKSSGNLQKYNSDGTVELTKTSTFGYINAQGKQVQTQSKEYTDPSGRKFISNSVDTPAALADEADIMEMAILGNSNMEVIENVNTDGTVNRNINVTTVTNTGQTIIRNTTFDYTGGGSNTYGYGKYIDGEVIRQQEIVQFNDDVINNTDNNHKVSVATFDPFGNPLTSSESVITFSLVPGSDGVVSAVNETTASTDTPLVTLDDIGSLSLPLDDVFNATPDTLIDIDPSKIPDVTELEAITSPN